MDKRLLAKIKQLQKQAQDEPVTIAIDWLSIYFTQSGHFPEKLQEGDNVQVSENCYLVAVDKPTLHFNGMYMVVLDGEEVATLLLNSKNEKFFEKNIVKLEVKNHALYSGAWTEILDYLTDGKGVQRKDEDVPAKGRKFTQGKKGLGLLYKSCGRLDIAINGMNSMHQLLNLYSKQNLRSKTLQLKNSSQCRAKFSAKVLNPKTMLFENFNLGSTGGNKMITVYNKTLELVKSGKKYIQEFWLRNGLIEGLNDLDAQAAEIEEREAKGYDTFHLEGFKNIYRFEIRLKSESIKEIKDFNLEMLTTAKGLASIVKLHCVKFFEPMLNDDPKISCCTPVNIIPFKKLRASNLTKIARVETDGTYMAKLLIHGIIKDVYRSRVTISKIPEGITTIFDRIDRYRLADYVNRKLDEWHKRYFGSTPLDDIERVTEFIAEILRRLQPYIATDDTQETPEHMQLASRHDQAGATAAFGEGENETNAGYKFRKERRKKMQDAVKKRDEKTPEQIAKRKAVIGDLRKLVNKISP